METKIITIDPKEIKFLEVNARYMKQQDYQRLVDNVKRDGKLTSVPFCCHPEEYYKETDGWPEYEWEVLSGNHRVQAAIDAGLELIEIMVTEERLTNDQRVAIQISHNSITGQDDMAILKELYSSIRDIDYKAYSGLDDETLKLLEKVSSNSMSAIGLAYQIMNIVVLPNELEEAKKIIDDVKKEIRENPALTMRFSEYDKWLDSLEDVGSASGIKNTATTLLVMLDIVSRHMDELRTMWENEEENEKSDKRRWVPISTIAGRSTVRISDGRVISRAFEKMISSGQIKKNKREEGLAFLASYYLNGGKIK